MGWSFLPTHSLHVILILFIIIYNIALTRMAYLLIIIHITKSEG
jgi:hypothetical protein